MMLGRESGSDRLAAARQLDRLCDAFETAWRGGGRPRLEDHLAQAAAPAADLFHELLALEVEYRRQAGEQPAPEEYRQRFPHYAGEVEAVFRGAGDTVHVGRYELVRELGRGGMGVVYLARDTALNRVVTLKMMHAGSFADPAAARRFVGEAEAVARLSHPHVVAVYDCGEHDGQGYFTMTYAPGGSVRQRLADYAADPRAAAALLEKVARAVHHAHERRIFHRDLKPSNILLDEAGEPLVSDFGLARLDDRPAHTTLSGQLLGTPTYMAPEQALAGRTVTPATDVYGLGATLYTLLTGRAPFEAASALEVLRQVTAEEPRPPRQLNPVVPPDLETVCLKCLQKEPARRYATAAALADDLHRFLAGEPIEARPAGALDRAWRWSRRNPLAAALLLALVLALTGWLVTLALLLGHWSV